MLREEAKQILVDVISDSAGTCDVSAKIASVMVAWLEGFDGERVSPASASTVDTPEVIEGAARAYSQAKAHCRECCEDPGAWLRAGIRAARAYAPVPPVSEDEKARADSVLRNHWAVTSEEHARAQVVVLRADVERLTKEREGERAELGHVRAELRDTAAKLSALRSARASCTHADLLGPVTEDEHDIGRKAYWSAPSGGRSILDVRAYADAVIASRRARAGEPTVSEEELDAAWDELRGLESIDQDNVRDALLAAAKVRAGVKP